MRADKTIHVPVLMTRAAGAAGRSRIDGPAPLVATRLYGSGVRMLEAVRLRGKDLNDQVQPRTVRSNKGDKDRCTTVPTTWTPLLQNHLAGVKTQHQQDLAQGPGEVDRPYALARQAPHSAMAWG